MNRLERNAYSEEEKEKDKKKKKKICSSSNNSMMMRRCCQVEKCNTDLQDAKQYHKRHKVCEYHAKAQAVILSGTQQHFCQQCSRFHGLAEFDETKRSCRKRLAGHNERRRKNSDQSHSQPEGSSRNGSASGPQLKDDDRAGKFQLTVEEDRKHFQT